MSCPHRAWLIITRSVDGTSSDVAKEQRELTCREEAGHAGPHYDPDHDEHWNDRGRELTHLLRHQDERA